MNKLPKPPFINVVFNTDAMSGELKTEFAKFVAKGLFDGWVVVMWKVGEKPNDDEVQDDKPSD